ncbi:MAG: hypothetical protein M1829_002964 [Trizodia sp. TS-e1964]|nr:MAG: hypothetical protein M1829_002964 [Trizodia sp. TS-e1964]
MNSGKPDEKQLLSSLLSILSLTKNLISEICNSACSRDDGVIVFTCQRKVNQTPSSLHAAETQRVVLSLCRVLSYLSKGLDYIGSPSDVLITDHPVTQGFLLLFSKIMSQIAELSPITELDQDPRISLSNADITDKPNSRNSIVKFADDSRVGLSQLLLTMIAATAGKATPHKLLFEGYISILLNRIGNLLSFSVFNGGNPESLGDDSNDPLNQQMPSDAKNSTNGERYYLIWILERALCFMSGMMDGLASNSPTGIKFASKASRLKSSSQVKQILPEKTKARLQNTLLKSIFKDNENDFLNSLNISAGPPPLADADDVTKCRKTPYALGSQDWFQEMLWKLLGWEILSSNIEHWMANDSSETESD